MTVPTKKYVCFVRSFSVLFWLWCQKNALYSIIEFHHSHSLHNTIYKYQFNNSLSPEKTELLLRHTTFLCSTNGIFPVRTRIAKYSHFLIFSIRHSLSSPYFSDMLYIGWQLFARLNFSNVFKYNCLSFNIWTNARQRFE